MQAPPILQLSSYLPLYFRNQDNAIAPALRNFFGQILRGLGKSCNFAHKKANVMDVAFILDKYFKRTADVSIDVFDAQTLNAVYRDVVNAMTSHLEIEVSVLQALSYCLYEMMDNVHIHSGKPLGTAMTHYDDERKVLRILIADDGMDNRQSLA